MTPMTDSLGACVDSYPEPVRRLMGHQARDECPGIYPNDPDRRWYGA